MPGADEAIKVAVRVRPFNDREKARKANLIIEMNAKTTCIRDPANLKAEPKRFAFDHSYWSHNGFKTEGDGYLSPESSNYADQKQVFNDLGGGVLDNAWKGYNCSLFAYGQTGSGKSYSMVGYGSNKGIVPIVCETLFQQIDAKKKEGADKEYQVSVSMLEIYCEKIRDLLDNKGAPKGGLKLREHPKKGFYVEGLRKAPVSSFKAIEAKIAEGNKNRTIAATNMNATSSRAHTIFQINFAQNGKKASGEKMTKTSVINLVDLAGSERHSETGSEGDRLKEGIVINQSLSSLGRCIKALYEAQTSKGKAKGVQVPYRDSVLTSLLKNALGGNSKTIMIAALSPADINYEETLSTLRFADRAKSIKTKAVVNESATDRLIRELREDNMKLQSMLKGGGGAGGGEGGAGGGGGEASSEELEQLRQQLEANQKEMDAMHKSWEQRLSEESVRSKGAEGENAHSVELRKTQPHFWNLNEDPALTNMIVHFVKPGESSIGNNKSKADIILQGLSVQHDHARLKNTNNDKITMKPLSGVRILVNGRVIDKETELTNNDRILFGGNHLYVFGHPNDAKKGKGSKGDINYDMAQREIVENSGMMDVSSDGKSKEDMILEEELIHLLPQVHQANAMSEELKKNNKFEIALMAPQARGKKTGHTEIYVKVTNRVEDTEFMWDKTKFTSRYYGMQELYQNYVEGYADWDVQKERDPFYEPPDSEGLIGGVYLYLQSLAYMVELDEQLAITDYRGNERGQLEVALFPCTPQGKEIAGEYVDQPEELIGKNLSFKIKILSAVGLPRKFTSSRCKYKFYVEEKEHTTMEISGSNPAYGHEKTYSFKPVTKQLVEYLKEQALYIEVVGRQTKSGSGGPRKALPAYNAPGSDEYKTKSDKLEAKLNKIQRMLDDALTTNDKSVSVRDVERAMKEDDENVIINGKKKTKKKKADGGKKGSASSGEVTTRKKRSKSKT